MEDQDKIEGENDVEAHKRIKLKATDEGGEGESDDFELHRRRS